MDLNKLIHGDEMGNRITNFENQIRSEIEAIEDEYKKDDPEFTIHDKYMTMNDGHRYTWAIKESLKEDDPTLYNRLEKTFRNLSDKYFPKA